jgi:hypothetical protein
VAATSCRRRWHAVRIQHRNQMGDDGVATT